MAFSELGPTYMSPDAIVGEMDCKFFFPPGYNQSETEAKQEKKKQKKRGKRHATVNKEASVAASEVIVDNNDQNETEQVEDENEEQDSDEEKLPSEDEANDNSVTGADKATSPIHENTTDE